MRITRSEFLRAALGAAVVAGLPRRIGHAAQSAAQASSRSRTTTSVRRAVAAAIEEYDAQGIHRTASDVDNRSAQWLLDRARAAGAEARLEPFPINRVDVRAAYVEAEGRRAEGLPLFDGTFTDAAGIVGRVAPPEYGHPWHWWSWTAPASRARAARSKRSDGRTRIAPIVAVTNGAHPGLSPSNALVFASPYGVPVLQVDTEDHLWLRDLTARGVEIRLVAHATRTAAEASNVVATIAGRDPRLAPIVIMTPRSGWWHCASERGGGIACWLEALQGRRAARPPEPFWRWRRAATSSDISASMRSSTSAAISSRARRRGSTSAPISARRAACRGCRRPTIASRPGGGSATRHGVDVTQRVARGTRPGGEARNIHDGGGRYVSLLGSGPFFHNADDRWPAAVDVAAVSRFSQAIAQVAIALANGT